MASFSAELNDYLTEEIFGGPLELENLETGSMTEFCKEIAKYEVSAGKSFGNPTCANLWYSLIPTPLQGCVLSQASQKQKISTGSNAAH